MTEVQSQRSRRPVTIAPSILTADFSQLGSQIQEAEAGGADRIHLDVMDGHFVPNITFGEVVVASVRVVTTIPIDVHLMIDNPERFVEGFRRAGGDRLIVHVEATDHLHRLVEQIKSAGAEAGIALNPATPIIDLEEIAPYLDMVLVMSVNPGFGDQAFIKTSSRKVFRIRRLIDRWNEAASVGVDGGIDELTAREVVEAGADNLVAGSAVFNARGRPEEHITRLRAAAERGLGARDLPVGSAAD